MSVSCVAVWSMNICYESGCDCIVFVKQKTAYELRSSDGSSDVGSSDRGRYDAKAVGAILEAGEAVAAGDQHDSISVGKTDILDELGRASGRQRVCQNG